MEYEWNETEEESTDIYLLLYCWERIELNCACVCVSLLRRYLPTYQPETSY